MITIHQWSSVSMPIANTNVFEYIQYSHYRHELAAALSSLFEQSGLYCACNLLTICTLFSASALRRSLFTKLRTFCLSTTDLILHQEKLLRIPGFPVFSFASEPTSRQIVIHFLLIRWKWLFKSLGIKLDYIVKDNVRRTPGVWTDL